MRNFKKILVEDADAGIEAGKRAGMKTLSVHGAKGADVEIKEKNTPLCSKSKFLNFRLFFSL